MNRVTPILAGLHARIAHRMREQDLLGWFEQVTDFMTAIDAHCMLEHVSDEEWTRRFANGDDPYSAVIAELHKVEC